MVLHDLLLTCQNQWLTGFRSNPLFTVRLVFEENSDVLSEDDYILKSDYCSNVDYLSKYRNRRVIYWSIFSINDILIKLEGAY